MLTLEIQEKKKPEEKDIHELGISKTKAGIEPEQLALQKDMKPYRIRDKSNPLVKVYR